MKRVELLSPAGNMEMLKYAVMYGADAVYLAGTRFGARKYANNFSDEELREALRFAHLYGVKIYVTINTLIYEREVEEFIEYVKFIYKIGVDAVLVQDFGMLNLIREVVPELEIHASTQMHNNGANMLELLKSSGVSRVVLDREMSLEEIKNLPSGIEKEVFCHGALCVSYSGQCLFSSLVMGRSGNRGECAGLCRLPYSTREINEKKYYLSLKDICTIKGLDKLIETGVDSLKIEGRMKSPEYVGYMTYIYRKYIDLYYEGNFRSVTPEEMKNIKLLFNRGFTDGYIMNSSDEDMVNRESPNHVGISLGTYEVSGKKIKIKLNEELVQGDTIRFKEDNKGMTVNFLYDKKDKLINEASVGGVVFVDNFLEIKGSGEVRKVSSVKLNEMIRNLPSRKVKINGVIVLEKGKSMCLTVSDGVNKVSLKGSIVEASINRPISEEEVRRQISKTGSTVYEFETLEVDIDEGVFVNLKDLNNIRREALEELDKRRTRERENYHFNEFKNKTLENSQKDVEINVVVETREQLEEAKKFKCNIFSANEELFSDKCVNRKIRENPETLEKGRYMLSDLGSMYLVNAGDEVHTDYMMNVVNSYTVRSLLKRGASVVCLSVEARDADIKDIVNKVDACKLEVMIYGKIELMKMKFKPTFGIDDNVLIDRNGEEYVIKETKGMNYLLSSKSLDKINLLLKYRNLGIKNFRIDFTLESGIEVREVLKRCF